MDVRTLKCPSCGGDLTLPRTLKVAHCIYCGSQLVLEPTETATNEQQITRYERLGEIALEAGNYADLSQYAEKILGLDTQNASGWIYKAHVMFARSVLGIDSVEEAKHYLRMAAQIAPKDERVTQTLEKWGRVLGVCQADTVEEHLVQLRSAMDDDEISRVHECAVLTAQSCIEALQYAQNEAEAVAVLEFLSGMVGGSTWIRWGSTVQRQLEARRAIQSRHAMQRRLEDLQAARGDQRMTLERLEGQTGFLAGRRVKQAERSLIGLDREIENAQKTIAEQESIINQARADWGSFYSLTP
jgi:tetratricopeptide (TPR) repeat protein